MKTLEIAIVGYGKMGRLVAALAENRGHRIACVVDQHSHWDEQKSSLMNCDVAIDFSSPQAACENIKNCFTLNIPIVVGTTGWYDHLDTIRKACNDFNASLFYAPNFSLGMNAVFALNEKLVQFLGDKGYSFSISEIHHINKMDAPSGTAIKLANDIIENHPSLTAWRIEDGAKFQPDILPIHVDREGDVNGYHAVTASSDVDAIKLSHEAFSRNGFALGAVIAAEFLAGKKGIYTMKDLLNF